LRGKKGKQLGFSGVDRIGIKRGEKAEGVHALRDHPSKMTNRGNLISCQRRSKNESPKGSWLWEGKTKLEPDIGGKQTRLKSLAEPNFQKLQKNLKEAKNRRKEFMEIKRMERKRSKKDPSTF
jgi:hypothetical protein